MAGSVVAATLFDTEKTELSLKWKKKKKKILSDVSRHTRVICLFLKNQVGVFFVPTNFPNLRIVDG